MNDQGELFKLPKREKRFEMHEHCIISGPRACQTWGNKFAHSHEGGSEPHTHPDCGPGSYTIDKDEWFAKTGLRGGGRKEFTDAPTGEQLEYVPRSAEENSFEIHVGPPPPGFTGTGGGEYAAQRMILGMRMTVAKVVPFPGPKRKVGA